MNKLEESKMFENVRIRGYRSLKDIELNDLRQFNLIIGKNNSGKTNLIEALYQAINPGNAALLGKIHLWKGLDVIDPEIWKTIFYKLDLSNRIEIISKIDNPSRERFLTISPLLSSDLTNKEDFSQNQRKSHDIIKDSTSMEPDLIKGLSLQLYYIEDNKKSENFYSTIFTQNIEFDIVRDRGKTITVSPFSVNNSDKYKCLSRGKIINSETIYSDLWKRFKKIAIKKKKEDIITILREFDSNLIDLELIGNIIYVDLGYNEKMPIQIMGYGFLKTLALLTDIRNEEGFIILIDEIENGLHHKNLKTMWTAIFKAALLMNNQIIATTHSFECIRAFIESYPRSDDNLRVFRIEREKDDNYKVNKFNKEQVELYLDNKWEIR